MNLRKSLKTRLIVILLLIGVIPALVINMIFYLQIHANESSIIERDTYTITQTITNNLEQYLHARQLDAEELSLDDSLSLPVSILANLEPDTSAWRTASNTLRNSITRVIGNYEEHIVDIFVTAGTNIVYNQIGSLFSETVNLEFIDETMEILSPNWSPWIWSDNLETHILYVTAPINDITGEPLGIVGLGISEEHINQLLHGFSSFNELIYNAYLIDEAGMLLSASTNQELSLFDTITIPFITELAPAIVDNDTGFMNYQQYTTYNDIDVLGCAKPLALGNIPAALIVETPTEAAFANITFLQRLSTTIILSTAVIIALLSLILSRSITQPINKLLSYTELTAQGDLSIQIDNNRKDEIGRLFASFNKMTENLREMISAIHDVVHNASAASEQLSSASEQNSATIQQIVSSISQYAQTTKHVSEISQDMSGQAKNVQELSIKGTEQMSNSNNAMLEILKSSKSSQQQINELEQSTNKINEVINIISEVAEQTNLLALNAAIEAARAGQHGRGFAVVADEVRKLAEKTQESVGTIMDYINQLRSGTTASVQVINDNNSQIESGAESLEQTKADFASITASIEDTVQLIDQVTSSGSELEAGMAEIAASSEQQAASIAQIANNTESVAKMAEELSRLVSRFKL